MIEVMEHLDNPKETLEKALVKLWIIIQNYL